VSEVPLYRQPVDKVLVQGYLAGHLTLPKVARVDFPGGKTEQNCPGVERVSGGTPRRGYHAAIQGTSLIRTRPLPGNHILPYA